MVNADEACSVPTPEICVTSISSIKILFPPSLINSNLNLTFDLFARDAGKLTFSCRHSEADTGTNIALVGASVERPVLLVYLRFHVAPQLIEEYIFSLSSSNCFCRYASLK